MGDMLQTIVRKPRFYIMLMFPKRTNFMQRTSFIFFILIATPALPSKNHCKIMVDFRFVDSPGPSTSSSTRLKTQWRPWDRLPDPVRLHERREQNARLADPIAGPHLSPEDDNTIFVPIHHLCLYERRKLTTQRLSWATIIEVCHFS